RHPADQPRAIRRAMRPRGNRKFPGDVVVQTSATRRSPWDLAAGYCFGCLVFRFRSSFCWPCSGTIDLGGKPTKRGRRFGRPFFSTVWNACQPSGTNRTAPRFSFWRTFELPGGPMATADYYRKQAQACLHMSRVCHDPVLAEQLGLLAAEFMEAAADQDD